MPNLIWANFLWLFLEKGLRVLTAVTVGIWIARYLGPRDFGYLNYALALTTLFLVLADLGLSPILVREIVRRPLLSEVYLGTAFLLRLVGALVAVLSIVLMVIWVEFEGPVAKYVMIIGASYLVRPLDVIDSYYQSQTLSKYSVWARNLSVLAASLFKVWLILNDGKPVYFIWAIFLETVMAALLLATIYGPKNIFGQWRLSRKHGFALLRSCWPLALSSLLILSYMRIDQIMIGSILGAEEVGVFSVAVSLSEFWLFVPTILISSITPHLTKLRQDSPQAYERKLRQLYSLMFWMGLVAGSVVAVFGDVLVLLLYGEGYLDAYEPLVISIWSGLFISQALARGIWIINEDLQLYRLFNNLLAVVLNILLNWYLIPRYGIVGAAASTLLTQGLGTWVFPICWRPMRASTLTMIAAINPMCLFPPKT